MTAPTDLDRLPAIKFFKQAVEDILSGGKTLEPRPRSQAWITKLERSPRAWLTYGPRMGAPTVFAVARIENVEIRPLGSATQADVNRIGSHWVGRDVAEFVATYTD